MSLSEQLRERRLREALRLTPSERVEIALSLGRRDVATFVAMSGTAPEQAMRALRRQRGRGRLSRLGAA
jgi:hypothetical protein